MADYRGHCLFVCLFASLLLRSSADYNNVGGPLAKSGRKPPVSKTRTTAFPDVDEGQQDPSFTDQNSRINSGVIKQNNWTLPAVQEKPQLFASSPGDYGDLCCWEPYKGQLINDIAQGQIAKPFYGFVGIVPGGDEKAATDKCTKEKCNVVVWFESNSSAALYVVHKDKLGDLSPQNFTQQSSTTTLVRRCLRQYDITPGCTELVASNCPLCDEFLAFIKKFKKNYKGCEFLRRFEIFKLNKLKIASLNEKRVTEDDASFTVTQFTDLLHDEFLKGYTGAIPDHGQPNVGEQINDPVLNVSGFQHLYLRFDWAERGVIPKVRDQSDCGSCYAFTSTDLVAAQFVIDRQEFGKSYTLAPQYILDCFKEPAAYGCDGGRPVRVMAALAKCANGGAAAACEFPLETCLPYQNQAASICAKPQSCPGAPKIKVEKYNMVDVANDYLEKQKISALILRGPLIVQIDASDAWQFYESGIIRAHQCTTKTNHAVIVTGYDFGVSVPAYIIRNTWSNDWGKQGYVYLEAGVNACGVGQAVTYVCTANCEVSVENFAKFNFNQVPAPAPPATEAPSPTPTLATTPTPTQTPAPTTSPSPSPEPTSAPTSPSTEPPTTPPAPTPTVTAQPPGGYSQPGASPPPESGTLSTVPAQSRTQPPQTQPQPGYPGVPATNAGGTTAASTPEVSTPAASTPAAPSTEQPEASKYTVPPGGGFPTNAPYLNDAPANSTPAPPPSKPSAPEVRSGVAFTWADHPDFKRNSINKKARRINKFRSDHE